MLKLLAPHRCEYCQEYVPSETEIVLYRDNLREVYCSGNCQRAVHGTWRHQQGIAMSKLVDG